MKINFVHLCDYAMVSREQKVSVLGIFSTIRADTLPYTLAQCFLAFEIEIHYAEIGKPIAVELQCVDADGNMIFAAKRQMRFRPATGITPKPGDRPRHAEILSIQGLQVRRLGNHDLNLFLNGTLSEGLTFEVIKLPEVPPQITGGTPPATP